MTDIEIEVPLYHPKDCDCPICTAAGHMFDQQSRDQETIKRLDKALNEALDEIIRLRKNDNHRIMCLEAEIHARSAATEVMREEIAKLKAALEFRYDTETGPAVPGERRDVTPTTSA